jgi:hypothetical protein
VADGLECITILVLFYVKLAKATAQIVVFLCQHFDLLLDLMNRKPQKKENCENGFSFLKKKTMFLNVVYLILVLPDCSDDFLHLLEEFSFAGRTRH